MTLYELTQEYTELVAALESAEDEEFAAELEDRLAALSEDIGAKGEGYARVLKNMQAEADALAAEIQRLQGLKKRRETVMDRMKKGILEAMQAAGARRLNTSIGSWSIRKNPPSVKIVDPGKIPAVFLIPQEPEIDRRAILAAWKADEGIADGAEIVLTERAQFS